MFYTAVIIGAACSGCPSGGNGDADAPARGKLKGFTFRAIGEGSLASFGWSGNLHLVGIPNDTPFSVTAHDCQEGGICPFQGPDVIEQTGAPATADRHRCLFEMSKTCKSNAECPIINNQPSACVFIYDAPRTTPLVGEGGRLGACGWTFIPLTVKPTSPDPAISGSLNLTTGEVSFSSMVVNLQLNGVGGTYRGGCMECVGDKTPNDGQKDGTCQPGKLALDPRFNVESASQGAACDINTFGTTTFIPGLGNVALDGNYSMDCAPTLHAEDGDPMEFGGPASSLNFAKSISANSPLCTDPALAGSSPPGTTKRCFCGVCSDARTACESNQDCPGGGQCGFLQANCNPNPPPFKEDGVTPNMNFNKNLPIGVCLGAGTVPSAPFQVVTRPNWCLGGNCDWHKETGTGTCKSVLDGSTISCFPGGTIGATIDSQVLPSTKLGEVYIADTASARCTGASGDPALDAQLGIPGLIFQRRRFEITPEYGP
ncbi:MAG TPA: hypothetical protein VFT22_15550 [Kofleriaceae bacterium]|nr:hypothetical protein [Kofleriaceae bacterium]